MSESDLIQTYIRHLDSIIRWYEEAQGNNLEIGSISYVDTHGIISRAKTVVEKICGNNSHYFRQIEMILSDNVAGNSGLAAAMIVGVIKGLKGDIADGYLSSVSQLIHGEVFSNYLDMSKHLLEQGFKDAAAVIVGGTLEIHLRLLCKNHAIDIERPDGKKKKAEMLNQELKKSEVYSLYDQKSITAWLDVRNSAAHGNYEDYDAGRIGFFIDWLEDFIDRNPT